MLDVLYRDYCSVNITGNVILIIHSFLTFIECTIGCWGSRAKLYKISSNNAQSNSEHREVNKQLQCHDTIMSQGTRQTQNKSHHSMLGTAAQWKCLKLSLKQKFIIPN